MDQDQRLIIEDLLLRAKSKLKALTMLFKIEAAEDTLCFNSDECWGINYLLSDIVEQLEKANDVL